MGNGKIETVTGLSVVALTRHIMEKEGASPENAYKKLLSTELYKLVCDTGTGMYLETNEYLCEAFDKEEELGEGALYAFINEGFLGTAEGNSAYPKEES